ncbi:hydroxyisourate hydrolase [Williamsia sp. 1135]|uniref:hydroxyisourate hydrolase n=1 Tax=Williamsia sp. 1135 TaxID=1889262 RepID=UPI000A0FDD8B|nr:hydroxyisourate hydrolase [Williamsia sp. 1135]ORM25986.1 hydroxyisourate hydrolase [Williamsia sp. 1135]
MTGLSTHVLDAVTGLPAPGLTVSLHDDAGVELASAITDSDGRIASVTGGDLGEGTYRLTFDTGSWFSAREIENFYPEVTIAFAVVDTTRHHHVPLLLSPFAYSTYRGS